MAAAAAYKDNVEKRLAIEKELTSSALKYGALTNEVRAFLQPHAHDPRTTAPDGCVLGGGPQVTFTMDEVEEALTEPLLGNSEDEVAGVRTKLMVVVTKFRTLHTKVEELKVIAATAKAQGTPPDPSRSLHRHDGCYQRADRSKTRVLRPFFYVLMLGCVIRPGSGPGDPGGPAGGDVRAPVVQHRGQGGAARDRARQHQGQGQEEHPLTHTHIYICVYHIYVYTLCTFVLYMYTYMFIHICILYKDMCFRSSGEPWRETAC